MEGLFPTWFGSLGDWIAVALAIAFGTGFLRKRYETKTIAGKLKVSQDQVDDFRKQLARANVRLGRVDPERVIDDIVGLRRDGQFDKAADRADAFSNDVAEALALSAEVIIERGLIAGANDPDGDLEKLSAALTIGQAADPENARLKPFAKAIAHRKNAKDYDADLDALPLDGMNDHDLFALSEKLIHDGKYWQAEIAARHAVVLAVKRWGSNHKNYAAVISQHAATLQYIAAYQEAEPLNLEALEIRRTELGAAHPETATSLNNLAGLYHAQGRYADAEPLYLEALEIRRTELGAAHPETLLIQKNLGMFLDQLDRRSEADGYLTGLRDRFLKVLPADHPWIADLDAHMAARDAPRADPNTSA